MRSRRYAATSIAVNEWRGRNSLEENSELDKRVESILVLVCVLPPPGYLNPLDRVACGCVASQALRAATQRIQPQREGLVRRRWAVGWTLCGA